LKCWEGSADKLEEFWKKRISSEPDLTGNAKYRNWALSRAWYPHLYPRIATEEAARRYYSAQEFLLKGANNVFTPEEQFPQWDDKFLDNYFNLWYRHENYYPLKESIEAYATFPIKTNPANKEPRLLLVTVDIEEGETVTFDSYSEKSEYGEYDEQRREYEYTINYDQGLMVDHVMASASVPLLYNFQRVPKRYDYAKALQGERQDSAPESSRPFWDGGLLSNTPTRELINHHKLFWEKHTVPVPTIGKRVYEMRTEEDEHKREEYAEQLFEILWYDLTTTAGGQQQLRAPSLDVYIVNLWPTEEKPFPEDIDFDLTKDRVADIINHDKTEYDLKVAKFVTDYIELTRDLVQQLAKAGDNNKETARKILLDDSKTRSKFREAIPRKYLDLLIGRFDVNEKFRLERTEGPESTISNKWADLSVRTVTQLFDQGKRDAQREFVGI
jgi:NTE family protein